MLSFHVKFVQTDGRTTVKQYAPDLSIWGHKKEKLLATSNFSFSHNVFKSCLMFMHQNEYLWSKGLKK